MPAVAASEEYDPWAPPPDPWAPIAAKREENIAIKDENSAVKMCYADKVPTYYHKKVIVPARHQVYTREEHASMRELDAKRDAAIAFRADVKRVFKLADKDGSGELDLAEITNIRNSLARAESTLEKNDNDNSGTLNVDEFLEMMMVTYRKTPSGARRILEVYERQVGDDVINSSGRSRRD